MAKEYSCSYIDKGCEFADSCLNCPLPKCIYEEPGGRHHWQKRQRDYEIVRLFKQGESISDLAVAFGVSKKTIQRAMQRGRGKDG